jgi:dihydroorotate dehydrogenase electron transfer subunit
MPADISAEVIANTRLSGDYNVLALAAPEIAAAARPGQFVMVKAATGHDPLLRRPFSVFEVLRDRTGTAIGISLLNKRIGVSTGLIYAAREGDTVACLGPLGRPFSLVDPPAEAWMVAGGVGLAPFAELGDALARRGIATTLFYGARQATELFYLDVFRRRARTDRRTARTAAGRQTDECAGHDLCVWTGRHARGSGQNRAALRSTVSGLG